MLDTLSTMLPAIPFLAQVSPALWTVIDAGGSKAVIAVLIGVVVYHARQNTALHETIHARDKEHGEKVQLSASGRGVDTQHFVDTVSQNFRDMSDLLNLQLDCFVQTLPK